MTVAQQARQAQKRKLEGAETELSRRLFCFHGIAMPTLCEAHAAVAVGEARGATSAAWQPESVRGVSSEGGGAGVYVQGGFTGAGPPLKMWEAVAKRCSRLCGEFKNGSAKAAECDAGSDAAASTVRVKVTAHAYEQAGTLHAAVQAPSDSRAHLDAAVTKGPHQWPS